MSKLAEVARGVWSRGDYVTVADVLIPDLGARLVDHVEVKSGERVLDVAAGAGNATIPAAEGGAEVVALDIVPALVEEGRRRSRDAGLEIDWQIGDAAELPFDDGSFDVVTSCVGCMFAQPHEAVAGEIARVLRPGGRLGLISWTPGGFIGKFNITVAGHMPPLPPEASPPVKWGDPDHVRGLLEPHGLELRFETETIRFRHEGPEEFIDFMAENFGPVEGAREALDPQGGWEPLRDELIALTEEHNQVDGAMEIDVEYLVVLGRKG